MNLNDYTQMVYVVGKRTPQGVSMLGTGFLVSSQGHIATTHHVIDSDPQSLVILVPHTTSVNGYQSLSDHSCQPVPVEVEEIDPVHDLAIVKAAFTFTAPLPDLGSFDDVLVGQQVGIFGFPHCVEGRRALTFQKAEIGAKVAMENNGIEVKHAVINSQARPGQSGSVVFSLEKRSICGVLVGAWAPSKSGISLGGINPRELHQTTHCVSAEYIRSML